MFRLRDSHRNSPIQPRSRGAERRSVAYLRNRDPRRVAFGAERSTRFLPLSKKHDRAWKRPFCGEGGESTIQNTNESTGQTYLFFHLGRAIYILIIHISLYTPIYTHVCTRVREGVCVRTRPRGETVKKGMKGMDRCGNDHVDHIKPSPPTPPRKHPHKRKIWPKQRDALAYSS
jgi:hypothetical protein